MFLRKKNIIIEINDSKKLDIQNKLDEEFIEYKRKAKKNVKRNTDK